MMGDLTVSENRLIAALDRIDYTIERAAERLSAADATAATVSAVTEPVAAGDAPSDIGPDPDLLAELQQLRDENVRLAQALAQAESAHMQAQARLDTLAERLNHQGQEAARLVATNEALSNANRNLLSRADSGGASADDARAALEAELDALHSARAAEIAQFSEVLDALETLLAESNRPANSRAKRAAIAANEERD